MPTADSLSFEILKTGENQVKILVIKKKVSELLVESFSEQNLYFIKSCPI